MKTLAALVILMCIGLSGCGQKGPLYLPQSEQPVPEQSVEETSTQQ